LPRSKRIKAKKVLPTTKVIWDRLRSCERDAKYVKRGCKAIVMLYTYYYLFLHY